MPKARAAGVRWLAARSFTAAAVPSKLELLLARAFHLIGHSFIELSTVGQVNTWAVFSLCHAGVARADSKTALGSRALRGASSGSVYVLHGVSREHVCRNRFVCM